MHNFTRIVCSKCSDDFTHRVSISDIPMKAHVHIKGVDYLVNV